VIVKRAKDGGRTTGLLHYLYGPGKANEHTDPHMVAAWDAGVPDPGRSDGRGNIPLLGALLDAPVAALESKPPAKHVYHVPVRLDPGDRKLTDDEWADIAREVMHATGVAPKGDPMGARWVAVRHADDHIHIVATLARQDGLKVHLSQDKIKMQACARELEKRYGFRQLRSGDKTASRWPTTAEAEKAARLGRAEAPRLTLQRTVRRAAAGAQSDDDFFGAIRSAGLRLDIRSTAGGAVTGYSVALPGDRTGAGRAVWFRGSSLAPDLSLPRVRERWTAGVSGAGSIDTRASAWQLAAEHVHQAAAVLGQSGDEAGAGEMVALGDFLATYAAEAPTVVRDELREAARAFERAGRSPMSRRLDSQASAHLRAATQLLSVGASIVADGGEAAATLALLAAVALAVAAAMRWHQAQQHAAQEYAAAQAGTHLRAATEMAYGATGGSRSPGRRGAWTAAALRESGPALTQAYDPVIRSAVPHLAETVLGEAAWPALAATLRVVENVGYDPARVLAEVAGMRGFSDAESTAEVLVWRLQRRLDSDTRTGRVPGHSSVAASTPTEMIPVPPQTRTTAEPVSVGSPPKGAAATSSRRGPRPADDSTPLGGAHAPTLGEAVRRAIPAHASDVLTDPASATLAAWLIKAGAEGHNPEKLLAEVAAVRDLADADSVAQVLTWRVQGRLRRDPLPNVTQRGTGRRPNPVMPVGTSGALSAADRAAREAAERRNQPRGPRR
jgi:MobA/VirD2-like, nuclease domain